ncbi:hypothetical protein RB598_002844 [Gaeumannomyces tritici]
MVVRALFKVKKVAIIGAGPCGLSAAKYLVAQKAFDEIVIFEQSAEVGGVWNYSKTPTSTLRVPQTDPFCPPDPPIFPADGAPAVFPSPMYDLLHTNIPSPLMRFSDLAFPPGLPIFPPREAVQDYLVEYSQDVRSLVRFSTRVKDVRLRRDGDIDQWDMDTEATDGSNAKSFTFDAVVVASGHYATTYTPDITNIRAFHSTHPGVITHAKLYRSPASYAGKRVVVVGNSASGVDIAKQVQRAGARVLLSVREPTAEDQLEHIGAEEVPDITEFLVAEKGVRLRDGRVEQHIDAIIFCTGYLFAFPFLESLEPPLVTNGRRVCGLYKDFLHIGHPTLAFPGLPIKVVPFPFSEGQAAIFARIWANALPLPSERDMREWEDRAVQERGPAFHVYPKDGDVEYLKEMHAWASKAAGGKEPPVWTEEQVWQRHTYKAAKLQFEKTGRVATSLSELGFDFEPKCVGGESAQELL